MKISVVIPAINEASGIGDVVLNCLDFAHEVIVVDGGSTDGTANIAESSGAIVIHQPKRGYGLALLTGFRRATGDIIATTDGDATYPVQLIPGLAEKLTLDGLDFISGCRFPLTHGNSMKTRNQIGNRVLTWLASLLWFHRFSDILSGMWVFRRDILGKLHLHSQKWDLSQEIKLEALKHCGNGFREIHIPYFERSGVSKLFPWKVGFENLCYFFIHRLGLRSWILPACQFGEDDWDGNWKAFGKASEVSPGTKHRNRVITSLLELGDQSRLLEFGCGTGNFAEHVLTTFPTVRYTGVDVSHEAVSACKKRGLPNAARFVVAGRENFRGDYDWAICSEVVEHLDNPKDFLQECGSYMPNGCKIVITTPGGPLNEFYRRIGHRRHYRPDELAELVEVSGFKVEKAMGIGFPFFCLYRLLLTVGGKSVVQAASKPPSLPTRAALKVFEWLFRLDLPVMGWQTVVVARKT